MIGQRVQSYRIIRQLGAGGMGVVYEAEDTRLGRHVALKFLPPSLDFAPEAAARFEREARIASSINHPNICTIHDIGVFSDEGRNRHFIVMELLEGESLRARVHGPLPVDLVAEIGSQIADALDVAHEKDVVDRDVKPANIFLTKRGQAKLLDFGIAKPGGEEGAGAEGDETKAHAEALTTAGTTVGSINYMSPEQARGEPLDRRTDLFSLGLVLYEMATGRQAFAGPTSATIYDAILNRQPVPVRQLNADVPEELERVIMRALEKDRRLRYQTASDLAADLLRLRRDTDARRIATGAAAIAPGLAHTATGTPPGAPGTAPHALDASTSAATTAALAARTAPRWVMPVAVGAVTVMVLTAGGFWYLKRPPAFTERDLILVADFANSTGDAVFDDALKQAVAVQLQQTPFVTLLADQQIQRTLRLMQRSVDDRVVSAVAREVCQRAGARATVEGSIAALGSSYVISLGVHDCQTGASLAQEQAQADSKEAVLKTVGGAVTALRKRLGESLASIQKNDVPADATTSSLEALRAYGVALKTRVNKGDEAAIPFLRQAVDLDKNFALAYAKLGVVLGNLGRGPEAKEASEKAYALRDRVSEYERLYIQWIYFARVAPDDAKARETLEVLTTTYPRDFSARNNFGTYFMGRGQFVEALAQFTLAHEVAPGEPLPASNAAYALFNLGQSGEAFAMADRSLAIRPDRNLALTRWVQSHLHADAREAAYRDAAVKSAPEDQVLAIESGFASWDGRLAEYAKIEAQRRDRALTDKKPADVKSLEWSNLMTRAVLIGGQDADALRKALLNPSVTASQVATAVVLLAVTGDVAPARRELPRLERLLGTPSDGLVKETVDTVRAYVRSADGKHDTALADLQSLRSDDLRRAAGYFSIGQIQEHAGKIDDAIASYRRVIDAAPALGMNYTVPIARMALARLLKTRGDAAGAAAQIDILKRQWAKADADFGMAKELAKL